MNFTYREWERFCSQFGCRYNFIRGDAIPQQLPNSSWVCIKHDVETDVGKALDLARIERKYKIQSTYYVQSYLLKDNVKALNEILELGHEIAYHYDVMDANGGDMKLALVEFVNTVASFEESGFAIKTVCPHGNPLIIRNGWSSNKDFFRDRGVANRFSNIFDIVVQGGEVIKKNYSYISDAGYSWKSIGNVESNDISNSGDAEIANHMEFEALLESCENTIISTHPHRWHKTRASALLQRIVFKSLKFTAGKLSKLPMLKRIMSRFYYLAKKI
jgi:hypothetical protein